MCCSLLLLPGADFLELVLIKPTGKQNSLMLKFQNHQNHLNVTNHFFFSHNPYCSSQWFCKYMQKVPACSSSQEKDRPEIYISKWVSTCSFLLVLFPPKNFCTSHEIDTSHRRNHSASTGTFLPLNFSLPCCSGFDHPLMRGAHSLILEPHEPRGRCVRNPPRLRGCRLFPMLVMQAVGLQASHPSRSQHWGLPDPCWGHLCRSCGSAAAARQPLGVMLMVHRGSSPLPICSEHPPAGWWGFFVCFNGQIRPVLTQSAPSLSSGCVWTQPQPAPTSQHRCKLDAAASEPWSVSFKLLILLQLRSSPWA